MNIGINVLALDFDGVIVDSMPLQEIAWRKALALVTPPVGKAATEKIICNLWSGYAGQRIIANAGLSSEQRQVARFEKDRIWRQFYPLVKTMPGAVGALHHLSLRLPIYIATTAPRHYVEEILKRESLAKYFQGIVTDQDVICQKPAPDALEKIAASASTDLGQLLLMGDTSTDLEMAELAGSRFLLLDVHARIETSDSNIDIVRSWEEAMRFGLAQTQIPDKNRIHNLV
ncbi:MAG: HAD family hydrolase [Methylococcales bacterium]